MKIISTAFIWLWLIFFTYAGIDMFLYAPEQIKKDKNFIEYQIKPHVDYIKNFEAKHGRLPTYQEFYTRTFDSGRDKRLWEPALDNGTYIRSNIDGITNEKDEFKNANWSKDFAVRVWRGEWNEYYYSWTDSYDANNYSLKDGIIALIVTWLIGLAPLLIKYAPRWYKTRIAPRFS
jgi:hypothetical protein